MSETEQIQKPTEEEYLNELSLLTYDENGSVITEWDEKKGWFEDGTELNKYGAWRMTRIYHPYTPEELEKIEVEKEMAALAESRRQLTFDEAVVFFMRSQSNSLDIPDQTSLRMMEYYPTFNEIIGQKVKVGFKFTYDNKMYKTIQPELTIQKHYPPGQGTESLYSVIDLEHTGAIYDPIPYNRNMELYEGKYYIQEDILYICILDSGQALHHDLKDLVGLYVKIVTQGGVVEPEIPDIKEWKQPTGSHDAYKKGDIVIFKGKKYESLIDANVYSPEAYPAGWKMVE